jgi:hypothetical protein
MKVKGSLDIDKGLSIPSDNVTTENASINLTTEDYYVRTSSASNNEYLLPTHAEGANESKDGQILIIAIGNAAGTVSIISSSNNIEPPSGSSSTTGIELEGPNANVTLYYDGAASKWIVIAFTGTVVF